MNKLGIWGIAIATAFVIGVLSANPVVEAVGGWQAILSVSQIKHVTLLDDAAGNAAGWNPPATGFAINVNDIGVESSVIVMIESPDEINHFVPGTRCTTAATLGDVGIGGAILLGGCSTSLVPDGSILRYTTINP